MISYLQTDTTSVIPLLFIVMLILVILSLYLARSRIRLIKSRYNIYQQDEMPYRCITIVKCISSDYVAEREFQEGDFVGKITGECPKCGNKLVIDTIYTLYIQRR